MSVKEVQGGDIQLFRRCEEIAKNNGIVIEVSYATFNLYKNGLLLGKVDDLWGMYNYLCGYDTANWGEKHEVD